MNDELFDKILKELAFTEVEEINFWGFGEPFFHQNYLNMCKKLVSSGIKIYCNTNGHYNRSPEEIINSGISKIIFSIDGFSEKTYKIYRELGDFKKVVHNIKSLAELRNRLNSQMEIIWQFIVFPWNEREVSSVENEYKELGIQIIYKTNLGIQDIPDNNKYIRQANNNGYVNITVDLYTDVSEQCNWPVIQTDGKVSLCLYDSMGDYIIADLSKQTLYDAFNGEVWENFRSKKRSNELLICKERCSFWYNNYKNV